jgi:hypothetical protein
MNEKIKILKAAWKMFNSGKYPKSCTLVGFNRYKGRNFAGILCTLLREKLNLPWVKKSEDYVTIGRERLGSTLPIEVANYFRVGSEAQFERDGEPLYKFLLKNVK